MANEFSEFEATTTSADINRSGTVAAESFTNNILLTSSLASKGNFGQRVLQTLLENLSHYISKLFVQSI